MSDYVTKIRTDKGDKQIDYNALANKPTISNQNLLINGDFQIWQRGESFSNIANKYTADRWKIKNAKGSTSLVEKSTYVPTDVSMHQSIHITETIDENTYLSYNFEFPMKGTYALSFWYLSTTSISTYKYDSSKSVKLMDLAASSEWRQAVVYFNADSMTCLDVIHAMKTGECYITGVKLEAGITATPFVSMNYGEELALCQRYYRHVDLYFVPGVAGTTGREITFTSNMSMRTNPIVNIIQVPTTLRTTGSDSVTTTLTYQSVYHGDNVLVVTFNSSAELGSKAVAWPTSHFIISVDAEIY